MVSTRTWITSERAPTGEDEVYVDQQEQPIAVPTLFQTSPHIIVIVGSGVQGHAVLGHIITYQYSTLPNDDVHEEIRGTVAGVLNALYLRVNRLEADRASLIHDLFSEERRSASMRWQGAEAFTSMYH
jgi:hypothetical protein